ncbi:MAG: TetR/AcrR family transcriptional regulator [Bacillota bacterium]|nr:TetR/AcrR family transcriptional regulator [Bacillota bacterium]
MGTIERNEKLIKVKKDEIVEAMEKALLSKSYDRLTIEDVAREAEYTKKTIYTYFNSKDEIYLELIDRKFNLLNEKIEKAVINSSSTGLEKIRIIGKTYFDFAKEFPEYMQAIINFDIGRNSEAVTKSKAIEKFYNDTEKSFLLLANAVREGIAEGSISQNADVTSTAITLWSGINGFIMLEYKKGTHLKNYYNKSMVELFDYSMKIILNSLRTID